MVSLNLDEFRKQDRAKDREAEKFTLLSVGPLVGTSSLF